MARLIETPFTIDIFDLAEAGIRRGRETVIVVLLEAGVPCLDKLESRFVDFEVALADIFMRDRPELFPAVNFCGIGLRDTELLSVRLAIQRDNSACAGPVKYNRLFRPVVCQPGDEFKLQADPFAAAVKGLGEIQSCNIKVANNLIFR